MTAGLPGAGIGGLFYFCLVLLMPFRELYVTLRGRSSLARWKVVGFHTSIVAGIFVALWAEAWLLKSGIMWLDSSDGWFARWLMEFMNVSNMLMLNTGQFAAIASLLTLAFVCLAAWGASAAARAGFIKPSTAVVLQRVE